MALGLKSFSFFFGICFSEKHNKTFHLFLLLFERKYILIELTTNLQPFYGLRLFWPIISHLHQSSALSQYLFFIQHSKKLLMRIEQMTPKVYKHFIRWNENRFGDFRIAIDFCFTYQRDLCVAIMLSFDCVWNVCVFFQHLSKARGESNVEKMMEKERNKAALSYTMTDRGPITRPCFFEFSCCFFFFFFFIFLISFSNPICLAVYSTSRTSQTDAFKYAHSLISNCIIFCKYFIPFV